LSSFIVQDDTNYKLATFAFVTSPSLKTVFHKLLLLLFILSPIQGFLAPHSENNIFPFKYFVFLSLYKTTDTTSWRSLLSLRHSEDYLDFRCARHSTALK
jgi:hypothetical protein